MTGFIVSLRNFNLRFGSNLKRNIRSHSSASGGTASTAPPSQASAVLKAGLTSGSLSLLGDVMAQVMTNRSKQETSYDLARAARMGSFGLFFYGPYQHFWYRALDRTFPGRAVKSFLSKVVLNQLALAPLVISGIFAWNLLFQNQLNQLPAKVKQDFLPTLFNGWKFWVPAASVNFVLIPLPQQVLYMSCCGVLWTGYLSYSSSLSTSENSNTSNGGGGGKNKNKNGGKI